MLDSLPEKKKKRKGFWWLFILIFLSILGLGSYILLNYFDTTANSANDKIESLTQKSLDEPKSKMTKQLSNVVEPEKSKNSSFNDFKKQNENSFLNKTKQINQINNATSSKSLKLIEKNNSGELTSINIDYNQTSKLPNEDSNYTKSNNDGNDVISQNIFQDNTFVENTNESLRLKQNINNKNSNDIFDFKRLNQNIRFLKPILNEIEYDIVITSLSPNYGARLNKFFFVGNLGYALFNGNPGLHLSSGIAYRVNKLLFLESELGYSYGADKYHTLNEIYHREYQYEANLLATLNLISVKHINFAFELGAGYTIYRGRRILTNKIDYRKHSGINIQGGLSLTYFIDARYGLGIKWGLISYDDSVSYLALRYLKRW
jgi:hypothetical protein